MDKQPEMPMVGTAGWSIPRASAKAFSATGTHLERYAQVLRCVEINSSFYRPHKTGVYEKWARQTPPHFRFAVKMPKLITHVQRLAAARPPLTDFLQQIIGLGAKLGPILVQLPPSLEFNARAARTFFTLLRDLHDGAIACEPRHRSWFAPKADSLLQDNFVNRVAADPAVTSAAGHPGGWMGALRSAPPGVAYYRLHGSPANVLVTLRPRTARELADGNDITQNQERLVHI